MIFREHYNDLSGYTIGLYYIGYLQLYCKYPNDNKLITTGT